jgi:hypothetical protein
MKNEKLKMKKGTHASLSADRGTDVTCRLERSRRAAVRRLAEKRGSSALFSLFDFQFFN